MPFSAASATDWRAPLWLPSVAVSFTVSNHAAHRYIERVDSGCTITQARAAIRSHIRAIEAALDFGCKCVRLDSGQRIILDFKLRQVVTILPTQPKRKSIQCGRFLDLNACRRKAKFGEFGE